MNVAGLTKVLLCFVERMIYEGIDAGPGHRMVVERVGEKKPRAR
jgi:hypothetical protein